MGCLGSRRRIRLLEMSLERVAREASLLEVKYFFLRSLFWSDERALEKSRVGARVGLCVCLRAILTTLWFLAIDSWMEVMFRVVVGEVPMVVVLGLGLGFLGLVVDLGCCWGEAAGEAYGVVLGEFIGVLGVRVWEVRA